MGLKGVWIAHDCPEEGEGGASPFDHHGLLMSCIEKTSGNACWVLGSAHGSGVLLCVSVQQTGE